MRVSILLFAGLNSAAAVTNSRADNGYWDVNVTVMSAANGFWRQDLNATYHDSELSGPITASCFVQMAAYASNETNQHTSGCSDPSVEYTREGDTGKPCPLNGHRRRGRLTVSIAVSLQQVIGLEGGQTTVYGSKDIPIKCGGGSGRYCTGMDRVVVSKAVV